VFNFDELLDRRQTDSVKWRNYPDDVLPLWVADMDFRSPPAVIDVIRRMSEFGVFGYGCSAGDEELLETWLDRLASKFQWQLQAADLLLMPGVVTSVNAACRALSSPDGQALVPAPVYGPLLSAPAHGKLTCVPVPLTYDQDGYASLDVDRLESAVTPLTRMLILCNPHNPVGRVYSRAELESVAALALRHDLVIISDEIHCDFVYPDYQHIPIATLSPQVAARTITLMAPSKTYNMPGLHSSIAIITDASLRARLQAEIAGIVPGLEPIAKAATVTALQDGQDWLDALLVYLRANRDFLVETIRAYFPGIRLVAPQGTYLAWLDCREAHLGQPASQFFLEQARVALSNGCGFGEGNEDYVRLNFGCPRSILEQALDRMAAAWRQRTL